MMFEDEAEEAKRVAEEKKEKMKSFHDKIDKAKAEGRIRRRVADIGELKKLSNG